MKKNIFDIFVIIVRQPFAYAKYNLFGRPISEYAGIAVKNMPHEIISCDKFVDITENYDYLAVLYADMPLITEKILQKVARTMSQKFIKKIAIGRGFIIDCCNDKDISSKYRLKIKEFISVTDASSLSFVYNIINKRINQKFIDSGVIIADINNTYIDDTASIAYGVYIEPNCHIKGNSVIKKGAKICSGSIVIDSVIEENVIINQSVIESSTIYKNTVITPYNYIKDDIVINKT